MEKREARRASAYWKCVRRREVCLRVWGWGTPSWWLRKLPDWMGYPLWFEKRTNGCGCRGRRHGNPKVGGGTCHAGHRPSWEERRDGRRLCVTWTRWEGEPDDCEA